MPLRLRRAADQFPRARWEPNNEHLVILSGETVVGSLMRQTGGTAGDRWFWSITCVLIDPEDSPRIGWATSREEAQQQFAVAWRAWLVRTELKEIKPIDTAASCGVLHQARGRRDIHRR